MAARGVLPPGYWIDFARPGERLKYKHLLGGRNNWRGAYCLTCMRPLLLLLTLDPADPRLGVNRSPWKGKLNSVLIEKKNGEHDVKLVEPKLTALPLFYCWSCLPQLRYRLNFRGGIDVLDHDPSDSKESYSPAENQPEHFPPRKMKLVPLLKEEQALLRKHNRSELPEEVEREKRARPIFYPRHQVGGEPFLVQKNPDHQGGSCEVCGAAKPLFVSLGDDSGMKGGFVNNAYVQLLFTYCQTCQILDVHNECD